MRRRRLLLVIGATAAVGLAGCTGSPGSPGDGETPGDGDGDEPTDDPGSNGDGGSPSDLATAFAVTATRCGNRTNDASVTVDEGTVTVEGTTWGNDACYTGRLESATLEGGTLTVSVVAERPDDDRACAQCITEIEYRATVEVPATPDEVVVVHRGETVATATP